MRSQAPVSLQRTLGSRKRLQGDSADKSCAEAAEHIQGALGEGTAQAEPGGGVCSSSDPEGLRRTRAPHTVLAPPRHLSPKRTSTRGAESVQRAPCEARDQRHGGAVRGIDIPPERLQGPSRPPLSQGKERNCPHLQNARIHEEKGKAKEHSLFFVDIFLLCHRHGSQVERGQHRGQQRGQRSVSARALRCDRRL